MFATRARVAAGQLGFFSTSVTAAQPFPSPGADHGEVFTRRWVAELILDLVGYTPDKDLARQVLVEPSCGSGAFLGPAIERLLESTRMHGGGLEDIEPAIRAFDLLDANASLARKDAALRLTGAGVRPDAAEAIAATWVTTGDFLLPRSGAENADYVVGNPPYIRLESVPTSVMSAYRSAYRTMRGRADIYVGFIERGLELLTDGGGLAFICADRWMRNQYGADLRELITARYSVETVLSMHDVDAFHHDVSAYPAIVVLRKRSQATATVAMADGSFDADGARKLSSWARSGSLHTYRGPGVEAARIDRWPTGRDFWPGGSPAQLALIADLESRFPPLEDRLTGTRVGIGVATGCDDVYITSDAQVVEESRLLPLLRAADTSSGAVSWSGAYLINPWEDQRLVDLRRYPRLSRYLHLHAARLRRRHVARRRPDSWYRTIDRVDSGLIGRAKLVFPDLKAAAHPVLDDGGHYPHHNLYYVVSDAWDLDVLGGLLLSDIANLFVGAYCVKMRGGTFRFQAQYLRRIRVPDLSVVRQSTRRALAEAFTARDREKANQIAGKLYGLTKAQLRELPTATRW